MVSFNSDVCSQIINEQPSVVNNDPIAATLDSLLNQVYVKRLSMQPDQGSNQDFKSYEVPDYSPEVYSKRMEKIPTPIPLCYNREVSEYINMYGMKKRGLTERVMGLSSLYFPIFERALDEQGLPDELKYLSIVESALIPTAVSRVGATGLWQFMHSTGKLYGLKINSYIDERRDPVKSTYAACQYFKDMYAIYNDWLLVIAAYNCGAGNVNRAIVRSGGRRTFWEIMPYLPRETRGYVPAFIAVTYLMNYSAEHNLIPVEPLISYYSADTVMTDQKVSLRTIADVTNTDLELLKYLNPIYKKAIIPDSEEPQVLRLPTNKISTYLANISSIYQPTGIPSGNLLASDVNGVEGTGAQLVKKYHKVRKGENLGVIAKKYHCTVSDLKNWNKLRSTRLSIGQNLAVYVMARKKTENVARNSKPANKSNPGTASKSDSGDSKMIYHTVQPGDSLWKIAQRYEGATVEEIKKINNLHSNNLKIGTRLKVMITG